MKDIEDLKKYGHQLGRILRRQHSLYPNAEDPMSEFGDEPIYDRDELVGDLVVELISSD